mmetsp:Transcript_38349/g.44690  ORF Transcript_38349/g.44690 Transcript_38349/m.44690 type:complete len:217 (+) Transcript_38349:74-724(+)
MKLYHILCLSLLAPTSAESHEGSLVRFLQKKGKDACFKCTKKCTKKKNCEEICDVEDKTRHLQGKPPKPPKCIACKEACSGKKNDDCKKCWEENCMKEPPICEECEIKCEDEESDKCRKCVKNKCMKEPPICEECLKKCGADKKSDKCQKCVKNICNTKPSKCNRFSTCAAGCEFNWCVEDSVKSCKLNCGTSKKKNCAKKCGQKKQVQAFAEECA